MLWQLYAKKRGPLNDGVRLEWLFARQSYQHAKSNAKNPGSVKFEDGLRFHEPPDDSKRLRSDDPINLARQFAVGLGQPIKMKVRDGK